MIIHTKDYFEIAEFLEFITTEVTKLKDAQSMCHQLREAIMNGDDCVSIQEPEDEWEESKEEHICPTCGENCAGTCIMG